MPDLRGRATIETARRLVASALDQPTIYPQIRSDLMRIRNQLGENAEHVVLDPDLAEILDAYVGLARRRSGLAASDELALIELARQLA